MERPRDKVYVIHGCKRSRNIEKTTSLSFKLKDDNTVSYGLATVHTLDAFNKADGRRISGTRLQETPQELTFPEINLHELPTRDLIALVANELKIGYRVKGLGNK